MEHRSPASPPQPASDPDPPRASIIIPTRNEAPNVAPLLSRLAAALPDVAIEVIFVDDSDDETVGVIQRSAPDYPFPVRVIARPPERRNGLSGAVVDGFAAATGAWLCVIDADLQHPPELVAALLARAEAARADIVVGSRKANFFGPIGLSRRRALTSQLLTLIARFWFPRLLKNVSDPLTGLFLVRREALDLSRLSPDGFKILLEILVRCYTLRVSELHFDFAARHGGESKADFREGLRFFRHLLRLRLTANRAFPRFVLLALLSLVLDAGLFAAGVDAGVAPWWLVAIVTAQAVTLSRYALTQRWVLGAGPGVAATVAGWPSRPRFWLANLLSLLLVRLPLLYLLFTRAGWPAAWAAVTAVVVEGAVRYALSEQWVFSRRGITMWTGHAYRYDVHDLVTIESQLPLPELAYFATAEPLARVDLRLRLDRLGTPTSQPAALAFSERLGRFGFGVAIMTGPNFTEVVLSPAFARSPYALYKSVLEPVLRWLLVQKGVALLFGAAVARAGEAVLILPAPGADKTTVVLRAARADGYRFLSDDFTLLTTDGRALAFPKPVSVTPDVLRFAAGHLSWRARLALWLQTLFYARAGRDIGLRLSGRRWPVATLNLYWQRIWPRPKRPAGALVGALAIEDAAPLAQIVVLTAGEEPAETISREAATAVALAEQAALRGFPPYEEIVRRLGELGAPGWLQTEQAIIAQAIATADAFARVGARAWRGAALPAPHIVARA